MKNLLTSAIIATLVSITVLNFKSNDIVTYAKEESVYDKVIRTGTLNCGYNFWPPFLVKNPNSGELEGPFPEIMTEAAKRLNLKINWSYQTGWGTFPEDLKNHKFDAMCAGTWEVKAGATLLNHAKPITYSPLYAYVRKNDYRFDKDLSILNNSKYKIAAWDGSIQNMIAKDHFPLASVLSLPQTTDIAEALLNLKQKKADIIFNDPAPINEFMKNHPDSLRKLSKEPFVSFSSPLMATYIKEHEIIRMFNTVFTEMQLDGTIERILSKYQPDHSVVLRPNKPYQLPKGN